MQSDVIAKQTKRTTWLLTTTNVFRRVGYSIVEHFVSPQEPKRKPEKSIKPKSGSFNRLRSNPPSPLVPPNSGELGRKALKTVHYWAPQNISQTVYTMDWKGFEATLEFIFPILTHNAVAEAELSLKVTHPTRVEELPFSLYGIAAKIPLQHWKRPSSPSPGDKDEIEKALLMSDVRVAPGTQNIVFNVTNFLRMVQVAVSDYASTDMIHVYFKIKRQGNEKIEAEDDGGDSTFNSIAARLGQPCHLILSDANPFHHFLRLDYTPRKPQQNPDNNDLESREVGSNFDKNNIISLGV